MNLRRSTPTGIRSLPWLILLVHCHIASAQIAGERLNPGDLYQGYLDGEFQIRHASARSAARVYYLIYAAALDRYATTHKELLTSHPTLALLVDDRMREILLAFETYETKMGAGSPPIVDRKRELDALEAFIASGYTGELKPKLEAYLKELKK